MGFVFALTLCRTLIASEFMPVNLLTLIVSELNVSEGTAGQATGIMELLAVLTSLSISSVTRGIDRLLLLLSLTLLMVISGAIVAFAPNTTLFMAGQALVGDLTSDDTIPRAVPIFADRTGTWHHVFM